VQTGNLDSGNNVWFSPTGTASDFFIGTTGAVGIGTSSPAVALDVGSKTDAIRIPGGTTSQRPSTGAVGLMRYNSTLDAFEGYTSVGWGSIGSGGGSAALGLSSAANSPYRTGELSTGLFSPESGSVAITSLGTEVLRTTASGYVGIGNTVPASKLDVTGDINATGNLALGGEGINAARGINLAQTSTNESKVGVYTNQAVTGGITGMGIFNYGVAALMTNTATRVATKPYNELYGLYSKITNADGAFASTLAAVAGVVTNSNTNTTYVPGTGLSGYVTNASSGKMSSVYGGKGSVYNSSTGEISAAVGQNGTITNSSTGLIDSAKGLESSILNTNGTTTDARGLDTTINNFGSGTVTTAYGVASTVTQSGASGTIGTNYSYYANATQSDGTFGTSYLFYGIYSGTFTTKWGLYLSGETANYLSGKLSIGTTDTTYPLQVGTDATNGNGAFVSESGAWTNVSDRRVKENIRPLTYGLSDVMKLKPVAYEMKGTHVKQIGFIAQDVEPVLPEVVEVSKEGRYGLNYGNMVAATVKAIQELKGANDNRDSKLAALEKENETLRAEIQALKTQRPGAVHPEEKNPSVAQATETRELLMLTIKIGGGLLAVVLLGLGACGLVLWRGRKRAA